MRAYVAEFCCKHQIKVLSRREASKSHYSDCLSCRNITKLWGSYGIHQLDEDRSLLKAARDAAFVGVSVAGGHRKADTVLKEAVLARGAEFVATLLLIKGDLAPVWVRDFLEGRKVVKEKLNHVMAAQLAKAEIRKLLPTRKITSRCSHNSIYITLDGFTTDRELRQAEQVMARYQMGHFNGMEDIYEYSNIIKDLPQVLYAYVQRAS